MTLQQVIVGLREKYVSPFADDLPNRHSIPVASLYIDRGEYLIFFDKDLNPAYWYWSFESLEGDTPARQVDGLPDKACKSTAWELGNWNLIATPSSEKVRPWYEQEGYPCDQ